MWDVWTSLTQHEAVMSMERNRAAISFPGAGNVTQRAQLVAEKTTTGGEGETTTGVRVRPPLQGKP